MKVLIDNFGVLVVEKCMLSDLADVLSPETVMGLSDDLVSAIAAESESSVHERQRTTAELKTLREGLVELNHFGRLRSASTAEEESVLIPEDSATSDEGSEDERVYDSGRGESVQAIMPEEPMEEAVIEIPQVPSLVAYEEVAVPMAEPPYEEVAAPMAEPSADFGWGFGSTPKSRKNKKR
ncbi:MAG: hypothetical protein Q9213_003192 [Squamulea squamosa]